MAKKIMISLLVFSMVLGFSNISMSGGHHGLHGGGFNFIDDDGDGVCDKQGSGCRHGYCAGYVDKAGDGYCDYNAENRKFFGHGYSGCKGGFLPSSIIDGTPCSYTGKVTSIGYGGSGMIIETEDAKVTIYGLGRRWFWDCRDVSRPVVGNFIEVSGYTVDYNEMQRTIAAYITIDGKTLELRDPETGAPLWRGGSKWLCQ
jgi:hypothetical protein